MPDVTLRHDRDGDPVGHARLTEIANMLGCSREAFFGQGGAVFAVEGAVELLDVWTALPSDKQRRELIAFARKLRNV